MSVAAGVEVEVVSSRIVIVKVERYAHLPEGMLEVGNCPVGDGSGGIERREESGRKSWAGGCVAAGPSLGSWSVRFEVPGRPATTCMAMWMAATPA